VSLETGIALMVPGIGAVMIAGALGIPIGQMMLWGFVAVVPTVLITTLILTILMRAGFWNPEKDELAMIDDESVVVEEARETARSVAGATRAVPVAARQGQHDNPADTTTGVDVDELEPASADRSRELSLFVQFLPLVVSLLLIAAGAVLDVLGIEIAVMQFLGAPAIALLLGVIGTALICRWALPKNELERTLVHGFKDAGQIFALTGVGGALAAIIAATPLGELLTDAFGASSFAPILLVWVIAAILHVAVGSVTLSAMTAAGILAPVAATLGINPVLIGLAAGAGALFLIHVTSNTFWLLQSFLGQSVRGALKSVTFGVSVSSVVALGCVLALSVFI
jgi:H+/gluconate symporter-like permease